MIALSEYYYSDIVVRRLECYLISFVDYCNPNPCHGGTCVAGETGYKCRCYEGYSGPQCKTS